MGEINIADIKIELNSRDEIPQLLRGLQYIYKNVEVRSKIFTILEEMIPSNIDRNNGRNGMELWKILILGTLRLNCNWDYDKLQEIANNHKTIRQFLGHGILDWDRRYPAQTLRDNISWFTPEILDKVNQVVVKAGYKFLGKSIDDPIHGRCDSFVVETDVHHPTDIRLLFDAVRKVLILTFRLCDRLGINGWRQALHNLKKIKGLLRCIQNLKDSKSKRSVNREKKEVLIRQAHKEYTDVVESLVFKAEDTLSSLSKPTKEVEEEGIQEIKGYILHAKRQIDQIRRRVLDGETIPHDEKVFSVFEEHTEWISKGKAGIIAELGLNLCIMESDCGFILHHHIMEKETDDKVAVPMVIETRERFPGLCSCSFDKGFYSPENREKLREILRYCVMPKKGRLSQEELSWESEDEFIEKRKRHSAVESAINALENHSLDRCCDHGIDGLKRYVSLAVVSRNIQLLGRLIHQKESERHRKCQCRVGQCRLRKAA